MRSIKRPSAVLIGTVVLVSAVWHAASGDPPRHGLGYTPNRYDANAKPMEALEVWLFTSEDSVLRERGTLAVIGLRSNTHERLEVSNDVVVRAIQQSADERHVATAPSSSPAADPATRSSDLHVIVLVKGDYPNRDFPTRPMLNSILQSIPLDDGHIHYLPTSVLGGFFQRGSYELQAVLYDGSVELARSKSRKVAVEAQ